MFASRFRSNHNLIIVDFTDPIQSNSISHQIVYSFAEFIGASEYLVYKDVPDFNINSNYQPCKRSILFNNYIDSGSFRKIFLNLELLSLTARILKSSTSSDVTHIGSKNDSVLDGKTYDFVNLDLRGVATIFDILDLFESGQVSSVVTLDNFWMHIANIYNVPVYVLFRGRLLKKNFKHHISAVNDCFFNTNGIIYLNI